MSLVALDPQVAALLREIERSGAPPVETLDVEQARSSYARNAPLQFGEVEEMYSFESRDAHGVPVRVYRPVATGEPSPALVYFHGGGWVLGSVDSHDGVTRALAKRAGCVVLSVDYRLAPEHRCPAAFEDAWTAARWAFDNAVELGLERDRIGVGGDSVGGALAALVARRGRDRETPFAAQLLLYPTTSTRGDTPSYALFANGYGLTREAMAWYWRQYVGNVERADDPDVSPAALADMRGLPRAIVVTAEADVLRDEAESYAERMALAGVETEQVRYAGMIHGFLRMAGVVERARVALEEVGDLLGRALVGTRSGATPRGAA